MMSFNVYVAKKWWDARRFGLSPDKLPNRLLSGDGPKVFTVSIPKAGTHLLERALCLHPNLYRKVVPTINIHNVKHWDNLPHILARLKAGQIIMSHLHYSKERWHDIESHHAKCLFMIRDPRDIVVSQANYILRERVHRNHELFKAQKSFRDCIALAIVGHVETDLLSIGQTLERFEGWLHSGALVIRFEDLVGSRGEGDDERQAEVLKTIYNYLDVPVDAETLSLLAKKTFSNRSPTFNNGASGRWRDAFDDDLKRTFKDCAGEVLVRYGYEADLTW